MKRKIIEKQDGERVMVEFEEQPGGPRFDLDPKKMTLDPFVDTWTASEMGKKGGASTSPDKVRTARENAKKGGRPIKQSTIEGAARIVIEHIDHLDSEIIGEIIKACWNVSIAHANKLAEEVEGLFPNATRNCP